MSTHTHAENCGCHTHEPSESSHGEDLKHILDHSAHYLPAQGPIGVFIHHNTLHAFQHLPFEEAVVEASKLFKTQPYMTEAAYRADLARGRIMAEDIEAALEAEPTGEVIPGRLDRRTLRKAMLLPGLRPLSGRSIEWEIEEGGWLDFRKDLSERARKALSVDTPAALWEVCVKRARTPSVPPLSILRPRDGLLAIHGVDIDEIIHPLLIRLCGAFLDQGVAYWTMPLRAQGLLLATRQLLLKKLTFFPNGLEGLGRMLRDQDKRAQDADTVIKQMLLQLGVEKSEWESVLQAEILALPGWAGLIRCMEVDPTLAPHDRVPCSLMDFLALRLTLTAAAAANITKDAREWRTAALKSQATGLEHLNAAAELYDVAQLTGLNSAAMRALKETDIARLCEEVNGFNNIERRRVFHVAYERRHERQILIPLAKHSAMPSLIPESDRLAAQVFFCIDEREESIRRHLEEVDPQIETFGAAGFFGVAVDYCGLDDAHGVALCPVVVKPAHEVLEQPVDPEHERLSKRRQSLRRAWATMMWNGYISTRTLMRGWLSTATLGFFSIFPLAVRVLSPLTYGRMMKELNKRFLPEPRTELTFMREDAESKAATTGLMRGFTIQEKVDRVASVLGPAGLHKGMARIVVVLGHGSTSLNNPHESAHDCGACGGRRGGPNGRLFALMANHPQVRQGLKSKGIVIPEDTWFVGGYHDTCNDDIDLFDLDAVPLDHRGDLARVRASLDEARARSAHERARRFEAASWKIDAAGGLRHVQERAEHLGEPRPEYGHCTNAVAIVGRRESTRGLFFDRRAFLISYDATKDPANEALARVLGAVIPVCGGISLEYYFSFVDNEGYGCGTKLPHNISGLMGVMNGYQSDLRTGLPLQMVEIHEPVRILFVIETTPERVLPVIHATPLLKEFLENRWIRLATQDPDDGHIMIYRGNGKWEPLVGDEEELPITPTSTDWYRGRREHLPVARIEPKKAVA